MFKSFVVLFLTISLNFNIEAKMSIDITRGNTEGISISFSNTNLTDIQDIELAHELKKVIKADLTRSGLFRIEKDVSIHLSEDLRGNLDIMSGINSTSLVAMNITNIENEQIEAKYRLWDLHTKKELLGKSLRTDRENFRRIGHMIADAIYHRITGESGYFDSRIAYIAEVDGSKRIAIMDQDSFNRKILTDGSNLVLTPRFAPDSQRLVYMSFSDENPSIYIRDISNNSEELIGNFSGVKSAPTFSPNGESVLLARSINGETDIYDIGLSGKTKKKLTNKSAINTSASYSPDQKNIVFNSDRSGSPQLYVMNSYGRKQHRISFGKGRYSTPAWSPRGDWIAFSKVVDGEFYIGVMKPDGSGERLLSSGYLVESPSWSPNGRIIIFTKQTKLKNGKTQSRLYSIDLTGENERLIHTNTDASDPSWSRLLLF